MNTGNHDVALEELMALLDGELPVGHAARVRAHVRACEQCQRTEAELRDVSSRLARWKITDAPGGIQWPQGGGPRWRMPRWLPLAASLIVVGGAGMVWTALQRQPARSVSVGGGESAYSAAALQMAERPTEALAEAVQLPAGTLLVRTAQLSLVPRDFDEARAATDRIIAEAGGFIGRIVVSDARADVRTLNATLRIPTVALDEVLAALKQLGQVTAESQDGEDVTQQSIDLDARLVNARASEKRLQNILASRTGRLSDVLDVEREISRVRGEIERLEASRQSLDRRITYAAITLEITEERKAEVDLGTLPVPTRLRNALVDGYTGAINHALELAVFLARIGPTLLLWTVVLGLPAWLVKRRLT